TSCAGIPARGCFLRAHLEDPRCAKASGAQGLIQEARTSSTRLDQEEGKLGTDTPENDSRETSTAADVDDVARGRQVWDHGQAVDDVLANDALRIALTREADALVPDGQQCEEPSDPIHRVRRQLNAEMLGSEVERPSFGGPHRTGFARSRAFARRPRPSS